MALFALYLFQGAIWSMIRDAMGSYVYRPLFKLELLWTTLHELKNSNAATKLDRTSYEPTVMHTHDAKVESYMLIPNGRNFHYFLSLNSGNNRCYSVNKDARPWMDSWNWVDKCWQNVGFTLLGTQRTVWALMQWRVSHIISHQLILHPWIIFWLPA